MPCHKRYWLPTVNCCLKELHRRSGRVPVLSSTLWQSRKWTIFLWYLSDILKKILVQRLFFFRKSNITWHQQKTKRIVKYHVQLKIWRLWRIICTFFYHLQQCNWKKTRVYEKFRHFRSTRNFCWYQQNWTVILKQYYWCLLNINWFQNVPSFIAILHIVQKLRGGHFWPSSSKQNILSQITQITQA